MASIIAVANQKGGVGKTTTTANLGTGLARRGFRVLLVDLDPQANLTAAFGLERGLQESIALCMASREASVPILRIEDSAGITVDVVPSSLDLAAVESALVNKLGRELRLREHLGRLDSQYDYVLVDTPPSVGTADDQRDGGGGLGGGADGGPLLPRCRDWTCSKRASMRSCT